MCVLSSVNILWIYSSHFFYLQCLLFINMSYFSPNWSPLNNIQVIWLYAFLFYFPCTEPSTASDRLQPVCHQEDYSRGLPGGGPAGSQRCSTQDHHHSGQRESIPWLCDRPGHPLHRAPHHRHRLPAPTGPRQPQRCLQTTQVGLDQQLCDGACVLHCIHEHLCMCVWYRAHTAVIVLAACALVLVQSGSFSIFLVLKQKYRHCIFMKNLIKLHSILQ